MKINSVKRCLPAFMLAALIGFAGCKEPAETPVKGYLKAYSDESLFNVMNTESKNFTGVYKDSKIEVVPLTARDGIARILNNEIKFFVSSRDLNSEENNFASARKLGIRKFKFCYDAVAVVVSRNSNLDKIRVSDLAKILESKNTEYKIIIPQMNSGIYEYVKTVLLNGADPKNIEIVDSEFKVAEKVGLSKNFIGLTGINTLTDTAGIKILKVGSDLTSNQGESYFDPLAGYMINGDYPLARMSYIFLNEVGLGLASGFTTYLTSYDGQIILAKNNLGPASVPVKLKQSF